MELLSVVIITYNEEKNIGRCIDSVREVADEVVVLDSFSTDRTVQIAEMKGAFVYRQKFTGYGAQKNKALEFAKYNYVLSLDADEMLDEELKISIIKAKKGFAFSAYKMNRCAFYRGKFIKHGTWYPESKIRLFDKRLLKWEGLDIHEKIQLPSTMAVYPLKGDILHFICDSNKAHIRRSDNFSTLAAQSLYKSGKRTNWFKIMASPAWFFVNDFFLRGGFLSGVQGWMIAKNQTRYHFLKYAKLYKLQKTKPKLVLRGDLYVQPAANTERLSRDVGAHA
ncbi:MAG: glycosyltransferase family 2 protein [Chitinophagaceae bacterium]|nr:MAG: glycosyltransferase family 2 protein [Chitinophagaceae bacterium]